MKVLDLKTGKAIDVNDSFGARLIEQGEACLMAEEKAAKAEAEAPKAEKAGDKGAEAGKKK